MTRGELVRAPPVQVNRILGVGDGVAVAVPVDEVPHETIRNATSGNDAMYFNCQLTVGREVMAIVGSPSAPPRDDSKCVGTMPARRCLSLPVLYSIPGAGGENRTRTWLPIVVFEFEGITQFGAFESQVVSEVTHGSPRFTTTHNRLRGKCGG